MKFVVAGRIRQKLKEKHGVTPEEIEQCFFNRTGHFLEDTREEHRTHPPTQWFIAETDAGRRLKVVFVEDVDADEIHIKTSYEPNASAKCHSGKYLWPTRVRKNRIRKRNKLSNLSTTPTVGKAVNSEPTKIQRGFPDKVPSRGSMKDLVCKWCRCDYQRMPSSSLRYWRRSKGSDTNRLSGSF